VPILILFIEKFNIDIHRQYPVSTWRSSGAFWLKKWVIPAGDVLVGGAMFFSKFLKSKEERDNKNTVVQEERFLMSLLHRAAMRGHLSACEYLIQKGINVNVQQIALERTPLHLAAAEGHPDVLKRLLELGANCDAEDKYAFRPLHFACIGDHYLYVELKPRKITVGHIECAWILMSAGADVNARVTSRITPYPFSAMSEVALYGTQGCTPLHFATMKGELQLVKALLKHGCDPEIPSLLVDTVVFSGRTAIGLTQFHKGIILYQDERLLTFGMGLLRTATAWQISIAAQYSLQLLWKKWVNKYPRMEGYVSESGSEAINGGDMKLHITFDSWTTRIFVLGVGSLKAFNYNASTRAHADMPVLKIPFKDQTVQIKAVDDLRIEMNTKVLGTLMLGFKTKTERLEWLGALKSRFCYGKEGKSRNKQGSIDCYLDLIILSSIYVFNRFPKIETRGSKRRL